MSLSTPFRGQTGLKQGLEEAQRNANRITVSFVFLFRYPERLPLNVPTLPLDLTNHFVFFQRAEYLALENNLEKDNIHAF